MGRRTRIVPKRRCSGGGLATIEVPDANRWQGTELVLATYPVDAAEDIQHLALRPWEARVYRLR